MRLSADFLQQVRATGYAIPRLSDRRLIELPGEIDDRRLF